MVAKCTKIREIVQLFSLLEKNLAINYNQTTTTKAQFFFVKKNTPLLDNS